MDVDEGLKKRVFNSWLCNYTNFGFPLERRRFTSLPLHPFRQPIWQQSQGKRII
ncbi:hypothetical protein WN48_07926 [Eufriesea mexicana]|uniref:Uncharacterized protein n=1 Tax=Eufriesea mexicana TaxID=516756 RepID=A0A310SGX4_9HYME|nr:hypothetical protein WN48_07926 [Eufriesea mexicana]